VPFDPNGMVMDLLRSCSRQNMRFVVGDLITQAEATWYRTAPNAKTFPTPHVFGSPVWDTFHPMPTDIGFNASAPRTYYNGRRINSSTGRKWAGPLPYFRAGAPAAGDLPRGFNGTPVECLAQPPGLALGGLSREVGRARGGLMLSGRSIPPAIPCSECFGPTPSVVSITLSGFTTPSLNQNWILVQDPLSPCQWTASSGSNSLTLSRAGGFFWPLTILDGVGGATYQGSGASCIGSFSMAKLASTIGGDDPLTLFTS